MASNKLMKFNLNLKQMTARAFTTEIKLLVQDEETTTGCSPVGLN